MYGNTQGKIFYNKLVRDGIQSKIKANGEACEVRAIDDSQEFQQELLKKVVEEAHGLAHVSSRSEFLDEYADLMVVLDALTAQLDITPAEIQIALEENLKRKGGYKERHFLHWSADGEYTSNESTQGIK